MDVGQRLKAWHGEDWHTPKGKLIRDVVYAMDTGLTCTVAFISGITISVIEPMVVLKAGIAEMVAGAVAICFGAFISTKAQVEFFHNQIEREKKKIEEYPEKETEEIRQIYSEQGFQPEEIEVVVQRITADKDRWLHFMIREEMGLITEHFDNPYLIGLISGISFFVGAIPPIVPLFIHRQTRVALVESILVTIVFLFFVGIFKTRFTKVHWLKSGMETMALGVISVLIGFGLGRLAAGIFH